ncbi:MAG: NAD-dependent epimerase/dehydratase family protein [Candidatus Pacebacteria bacterium]|nr:NAD-dependent epimerase/dehydratase family protein [Candidatus Paceibacterota bacterium]PIR60673.1 MAG: NAD-dependent dehydratase [Candidatus Pacebacteria bacterium CG10_big_fil_rev_8_21_14_0_10_44_54]
MNRSNQTAVITGVAGFVGSHLCDALLKQGYSVYGIDNFITGQAKNLDHLESNSDFHFIRADVSQPAANYLPKLLEPDVVYHLASPASPPRYQAHPVETYLVNSIGTHYLLQYLKTRASQARFIFASTSEVYGDPTEHPQSESYWGNVNPNGVRSCYDEAKRLGETICGVHTRDFGMDVRIVRIFNTYGPRMDLADGRIIPNFIAQVRSDHPLTVYGDGSQTRSFCYVSDLVEGILLMGTLQNLAGETINLGNPNEEHTAIQTAELVKNAFEKPGLELLFKDLPGDDPTRRKPDITKARALLNWSPKVSFAEGLRRVRDSFSN